VDKYVQVLLGEPKSKRPPEIPVSSWDDKAKMNIGVIWWDDIKCINLD
jgi:hypothetical protein